MPSTATDRVDGVTTSVAVKAPVVVVAQANITLSGLQTIDSVALAEGDRVLVRGQTNAVENGIYVASALAWKRAKDFDGPRDVTKGTLVVTAANAGLAVFYRVTSNNPIIPGVSQIQFTSVSAFVSSLVRSTYEINAVVTPINYSAINSPVLDGTRYGIVGDNATDNTVMLNNAIAVAVAMGGGVIMLPPGTIKYGTGLSVPVGVQLCGCGKTATQLKYTGSGIAYLLPTSSGRTALRQLRLTGTAKTGTGVQVGDIDFTGYHLFENVFIDGFSVGVRLAAALWTTFRNCEITQNIVGVDFNAASASHYSTTVTFDENCVISSNDQQGIKGSYVPVNNQSIRLSKTTIESNCLTNTALPQACFSDGVGGVQGLTIDGRCHFEHANAAVHALDLKVVDGFTINANFFGGNDCIRDSIGGALGNGEIHGCFASGQAGKFINMVSEQSVVEHSNSYSGAITLTGVACRSLSGKGIASWQNDKSTLVTSLVGTGGGPAVYSLRSGQYTRMGNKIDFYLHLVTTGLGGMTGPVSITGMPVAASNDVGCDHAFAVSCSGITPSGSNNHFVARMAPNSTTLTLWGEGTAAPAQVDAAALAAATTIRISGSYQTV